MMGLEATMAVDLVSHPPATTLHKAAHNTHPSSMAAVDMEEDTKGNDFLVSFRFFVQKRIQT